MRTDDLLLHDVLDAIAEILKTAPATQAAFDNDKLVRSHIFPTYTNHWRSGLADFPGNEGCAPGNSAETHPRDAACQVQSGREPANSV